MEPGAVSCCGAEDSHAHRLSSLLTVTCRGDLLSAQICYSNNLSSLKTGTRNLK